jgi:hypothetical protein
MRDQEPAAKGALGTIARAGCEGALFYRFLLSPALAQRMTMEAPVRRVFVVTGMHRAGTSVVARGLSALSVDLGDRLMSADPRMNARGFFEDVDVVGIDDALLDALGADWKSVALLDDVAWDAPLHADARNAARALLEARLARSGMFGFKDPRVARLLPFWQCVFAQLGCAHAYVIAVRHPRAVIDSLSARDALDTRRSAWLWLTHVACALRYTQGLPRVIVDYDRLLAAPARELARMARALGLSAPMEHDPAIASFAQGFLSTDLRHAEYAASDLEGGWLPPLAVEACVLAGRLASDELDANAADATDAVDRLWRRLSTLSPLLSYAGSVGRVADEMPRVAGELAHASESLQAAIGYNNDLLTRLHVAVEYSDDLKTALERKERELVAAHERLGKVADRVLGRIVLRRIVRES